MAKNKELEDEVVYEEEVGGEVEGSESSGGNFFQKYRRYLIIGGAAIVAAVGFLFYRNMQRKAENAEAQASMALAVAMYERDSFNLAINGDGGQVTGLASIASDYEGTDAGNLANFYVGTAYLHMGQLDEGMKYLEAFEMGDNMVSASALSAMAFVHEQKGEFKEAAAKFEEASKVPEENRHSTPYYLMEAARNLEAAGDKSGALKLYETVKNKYPQSQAAAGDNIDKYIARLSSEDFD